MMSGAHTASETEMRAGRARWPLATGRALTLGGALLFFITTWLPWTQVSADQPDPTRPGHGFILLLDPALIGAPPLQALFGSEGAFTLWSALTTLGILLASLLWARARSAVAWIALPLAGAWFLAAALVTCSVLVGFLFQPGTRQIPLYPGGAASTFIIAGGRTLPAAWLAVAALLVYLVGLFFFALGVRRTSVTRQIAAPTVRRAPGVYALTMGAVAWAVGFLASAWATLNCSGFVLVSTFCTGLGADGALRYGMNVGVATDPFFGQLVTIDPLIARAALGFLLAGGAALVVAAVWRRALSRTVCAWASVWLVAASALALVALAGVNRVVANPAALGLPAGAWDPALGMYGTFLALLVCLVGVSMLWVTALTGRTSLDG